MCAKYLVILSKKKNSTAELIHPNAYDVTFYKYFLKHESFDPVAKIMWDPINFLIINVIILISFHFPFCSPHPAPSPPKMVWLYHYKSQDWIKAHVISAYCRQNYGCSSPDNYYETQVGYSFLYSVLDHIIEVTCQKLG